MCSTPEPSPMVPTQIKMVIEVLYICSTPRVCHNFAERRRFSELLPNICFKEIKGV